MSTLLLRGLEQEARIVRTPFFDEIDAKIAAATSYQGVMAVHGPYDSGKRVALQTGLAAQTVPHVTVPLTPMPSDKDLIRLVYAAVHKERDVFDLRSMQDELIDTLTSTPSILVVDHAEQLTTKAANQIQYLRNQARGTLTVILLGGPELGHAIATSARLQGDVAHTVHVTALQGEELIHTVRAMHPLFGMADHGLLQLIDKQICQGLLGNWAKYLRHGLRIRDERLQAGLDAPVLDADFARAITALTPNLPTSRKRR